MKRCWGGSEKKDDEGTFGKFCGSRDGRLSWRVGPHAAVVRKN
jgi:hypothetical protein